MDYVCQLCGYVYQVKAGDPETALPRKRNLKIFRKIGSCPLCGASKEDFEPVEEEEFEEDEV
jgi:rubredoxin